MWLKISQNPKYLEINKYKRGSFISHWCAELKTHIHMHSNSITCPKTAPPPPSAPSAPVFEWLSHLTLILRVKIVYFHRVWQSGGKISKNIQNVLYICSRNLIIWPQFFIHYSIVCAPWSTELFTKAGVGVWGGGVSHSKLLTLNKRPWRRAGPQLIPRWPRGRRKQFRMILEDCLFPERHIIVVVIL